MNGLACLIFRDQLSHFRAPLDPAAWLPQPQLLAMGATAALTVALVQGGPKLLAHAGVKKERAAKVRQCNSLRLLRGRLRVASPFPRVLVVSSPASFLPFARLACFFF
jgi:hypothetical protein